MFAIPHQSIGFHTRLLEFLFEQDLQITRYTYQVAARNSHAQLAFFAGIRYENFISPLLDDSELLEAVFMKSGHQLRGLLHQPRLLHALDTETLTDALITSTVTDWVDGCRVLLDANIISYLGDPSSATRYRGRSLLSISALFNRLDMLQFWLAQREECDEQQLNLIGYIEDALSLAQGPRSGIPIMDVIQLLLSHLIKQRHEDAHLRARLEQLVPELISQYDSFGEKLQDFVIDVLIPTMRRTAKELKEEDQALYAAGRRELGVVMDEDEDVTDWESSEAEEEETDAEEESDDEY
ncbi:hypothetical protein J4E81_009057 [Alternaria sp. BMP 2799]|nr:hypothetical protein J4E81_009057 [Alternaria sp. BMP 2799]